MGKPRTTKVNRTKRTIAHGMMGQSVMVHNIHTKITLDHLLWQQRDGLTSGEIKHLEETMEMVKIVQARLNKIHYRLKF
jgi:hypothetical protein